MTFETMDPVLWVPIEHLTSDYIKPINFFSEIVFIYLESPEQ